MTYAEQKIAVAKIRAILEGKKAENAWLNDENKQLMDDLAEKNAELSRVKDELEKARMEIRAMKEKMNVLDKVEGRK